MRLVLSIFATVSICAALAGCSKSNQDNAGGNPVNNEQGQAGPAWKVSLKSSCGDTQSVESCVGAFGFSVSADGKFLVGPGPANQQLTGTVTTEELKALDAALTKAATTAQLDAEHADTCQTRETAGSDDTVTVTRQNRDRVLMRTAGTDVCFQTASSAEASELHNAIKGLAEKYYLLPFPDACADSVQSVLALFDESQNCNTDSDCAYAVASFDNNYEVVPAGSSQWVAADTCRAVKPLAVGNITAIVNNQARIRTALDSARDVCGDRFVRSDCSGRTGFDSATAAPVCQQNKCRINPSIEL